MRTGPAPALAEAVTSVAALCSRALRRGRTILGALCRLTLAVHVGASVLTFRLRLLRLGRGRRRLRNLRGQRSKEHCCERYDTNESAQEKHSYLSFRLSVPERMGASKPMPSIHWNSEEPSPS